MVNGKRNSVNSTEADAEVDAGADARLKTLSVGSKSYEQQSD
jgi:hypothetical protein